MKVIQLIYSLSSGGAEKFVVDLSNQLTNNGVDVTVCMLRSDDEYSLTFNKQFLCNRVKFHSMKFKRGFSFGKCRQLEKFILSENPDVVHCHLNVIPYIFRLALFNKNITFVHTLHNMASNTVVNIQYYLNRFFYGYNIIHPVCISKLCQKSYETYYRLRNAPFIDNGRAFVSPSIYFEEVKKEVFSYKWTDCTKIFIHVARCHPQKNQDLLVRAFNRLIEKRIDATLLILGYGYDSEEGRRLQKIACNKIHFLGEKNNVNDYLLCSDVFCLSSSCEGLPISLLEALSCGVTPVCTAVGGIPDVITDGVNGYLSSELSIDAYCEALQRFIINPLSRNTLINYFKANYSIEVCAVNYERFYNKICFK